ncbi:MAG: hypothetical protein KatS3mg115_2055 [Candidatus Poribacteria bacterium]|nr:MAG: hypothetical protein KatS3mg115_2055 [Candidatus Poribacteria bacterium]
MLPEGAREALRGLPEVEEVEPYTAPEGQPGFRVHGKENADLPPALFRLASERNWPVRELRREVRTLETVFNELARGA